VVEVTEGGGRWVRREEEDNGFGEKRVKKIMQWYLSLCTLIKRVDLRLACIQVSSEQASWKSSRPSMAVVPQALCMGTSWTGEGSQTKKAANEAIRALWSFPHQINIPTISNYRM
jgi:hypothetical protein